MTTGVASRILTPWRYVMVKDPAVAAGMLEAGEVELGRTLPIQNIAELQRKGFGVISSQGIRCRYLSPSTLNEGSPIANKKNP